MSCPTRACRFFHVYGRDDKAAASPPVVAPALPVSSRQIEADAVECPDETDSLMTGGLDASLCTAEQGGADAAAGPFGKHVERQDLAGDMAAESDQAGAQDLGHEVDNAAVRHAPGIAVRLQSGGPAFHFGPAVGPRAEPADRFLVDPADERRIAGRPRPDRDAGRQSH